MSDNENPPPSLFAMLQPDPRAVEQARMANETLRHDMRSLIDSLTPDQAHKLLNMLTLVENSPEMCNFFQGQISAWMDLKHGKCVACGNDHDAILSDMSGQPKPTVEDEVREEVPETHPDEQRRQLLANFEIEEGELQGTVQCIHCKSVFPNLADRMLRKPGKGGCATCIEKEKWG